MEATSGRLSPRHQERVDLSKNGDRNGDRNGGSPLSVRNGETFVDGKGSNVTGSSVEQTREQTAVNSTRAYVRSDPHIARYNILLKEASKQMKWRMTMEVLSDMTRS